MAWKKAERGRDTVRAAVALVRIRRLYSKGNASVAGRTAAAMRRTPATQSEVDASGVQPWHVARAVWRAKRWLPFHSTCLQTALATQIALDARGVASVVRVGVHSAEADAHAWVEVGDFVLDDQRIASRFSAFELSASTTGGEG
jgi:hypothetical protein